MRFSIGDKVVKKTQLRAYTSYSVDEVVGILGDALLVSHYGTHFGDEIHKEDFFSEPGSRGWKSSIERCLEEELLTLAEAEEEMTRLEAEKSKLEIEFEQLVPQIHEKLLAAAKLTNEAAALITGYNHSFRDIVDECGPLYKALKSGGWSHSTMRCKMG